MLCTTKRTYLTIMSPYSFSYLLCFSAFSCFGWIQDAGIGTSIDSFYEYLLKVSCINHEAKYLSSSSLMAIFFDMLHVLMSGNFEYMQNHADINC